MRIAKRVMLAACGAILATAFYHDVSARTQNEEHIGAGIYLDMPKIESVLTNHERYLFLHATDDRDHKIRVVKMLAQKLYGDYESADERPHFFPTRRYASSYLQGQCRSRGVCRHKALILAEILNHIGIEAHVEVNLDFHLDAHAWVYIDDLDLISDPEYKPNYLYTPDDYYQNEVAKHRVEVVTSGAYYLNEWLGGIVR